MNYEELIQRVEPALQQASDWLFDFDRLPSELANDAEIKKFNANIFTTMALANVTKLIQSFYSFQYKVMEDKERMACEKAEEKRRDEEEARRKAEREAQFEEERNFYNEINIKDADSAHKIGMQYAKGGDGVQKNIERAVYCLTKAAEKADHQNNGYKYNLGFLYADGSVIPKNSDLADFWFEQFKKDNLHVPCNSWLQRTFENAVMYCDGDSMCGYSTHKIVEKISRLYLVGEGVTQSFQKAEFWDNKADIIERSFLQIIGMCVAFGWIFWGGLKYVAVWLVALLLDALELNEKIAGFLQDVTGVFFEVVVFALGVGWCVAILLAIFPKDLRRYFIRKLSELHKWLDSH